jgi:hypothetical protein
MLLPAVLLVLVGALTDLVTGSLEVAVTVAMGVLSALLVVLTWAGCRPRVPGAAALLWALGTGAVGAALTVFKVLA